MKREHLENRFPSKLGWSAKRWGVFLRILADPKYEPELYFTRQDSVLLAEIDLYLALPRNEIFWTIKCLAIYLFSQEAQSLSYTEIVTWIRKRISKAPPTWLKHADNEDIVWWAFSADWIAKERDF